MKPCWHVYSPKICTNEKCQQHIDIWNLLKKFFFLLVGKRENPSEHGLAYDVVMELCTILQGQGYRLYFDNFFTSPHLLARLCELGILATGTTVANRKGYPKEFKDDWAKRARRGNCRWFRLNEILAMQWMDKKVINPIFT